MIIHKKISSGSSVLDELLGGGFEPGVISTLYGEAGTGKTNICILVARELAGQGKRVIFVDSEGGFSTERAAQLAFRNYKDILKRIIILEPTSFEEQKMLFDQIADIAVGEKVSAIIVDSIVMLYRLKLGDRKDVYNTNRELAKQLRILSEIARKKNLPVIVTNQVYADFKSGDVRMVGGNLLKYWSKCIIKIEKVPGGIRKASIFKHRSLPEGRSVLFEIKERGLEEVKES